MGASPKGLLARGVLAPVLLSGSSIPPITAAEDHQQPYPVTSAAEQADTFRQLMSSSMQRMHTDMMVAPSGDPDLDFARMMIPHHQGAVDMAKAELIYGRNKVLRRLAQGIVVEQQQEIEVMRHAIADLESARSR